MIKVRHFSDLQPGQPTVIRAKPAVLWSKLSKIKHISGLAHFNWAGQHGSSERRPLLPSQSFGYICKLILPNPSNKFGLTPPKPHFPTGTSLSIIDNNDCTCQLVNDCVVTGWGKNAFSATYFNSQLKKVQIIVVSGLLIESFVNKSNSTNSL